MEWAPEITRVDAEAAPEAMANHDAFMNCALCMKKVTTWNVSSEMS